MVNKEQKQKDGFGLPSTDVRKKDNALLEAARIADKMAKWYAEFGKENFEKLVDLEEAYEVVAEPTSELTDKIRAKEKAELEGIALAEEATAAVAKQAAVDAKAKKVKELKEALAKAEEE